MSNNKYKILVVEDDHNIASFVQTVLESNGYQVLTAQRCQQGILMLSSHVPDLVVLDLGLPDMDGEEFIRIVRRNSMIPIIVLSARTEESDKVPRWIWVPMTISPSPSVLRSWWHGFVPPFVPPGIVFRPLCPMAFLRWRI